MTGRFGRIRQVVGYAVGFLAAFVLWLLLGAAAAHADDDARPVGDSPRQSLTSSLVGVVDDVTAPLAQDSGRLVHHATDTVRRTVARVPAAPVRRSVEPTLRLVDDTADRVASAPGSAAAAPDAPDAAPSVEHATSAGSTPQRADSRRVGRHVPARTRVTRSPHEQRPAVGERRVLRPAASLANNLEATVSSTRAAATLSNAPAAVSITPGLPLPSTPTPSIPADRTSAVSASGASTEAAPSRWTAPVLPSAVPVAAAAAADPLSATDPLPDCSPD